MKGIPTKIWVFMIVLLYLSCVDKIQLDISKLNDFGLVIQGVLAKQKDGARVEVQFRVISSGNTPSATVRVQEAILHNSKSEQISMSETSTGIYSADIPKNSSFTIDYDTKYWLKVRFFNNDLYQSDTVKIEPSVPIDSFSYAIQKKTIVNQIGEEEEKKFVQFRVNSATKDIFGKKIFKWDFQNAFKYTDQLEGSPPNKLCYVQQKADVKNVKLYDARNNEQNSIENFIVYEHVIDYLFAEGYYGTVIQQSLSQEAYDYFLQVNELNNREENIYEPPAGRILTNIRNITNPNVAAYGFFHAVEQDTARLYISPAMVGNPKRQCPVPPSEYSICPVYSCCDCLKLSGSSLEKPNFWK